MEMLKNILNSLSQNIVDVVFRLIGALLIVIIGFKVVKTICNFVGGTKFSKRLDETAASFLKSFLSVSLKVLLVVTAIAVMGVPMTTIVTVIGTAGLAIGLALQGSLSNIAGGFIIFFFKPFAVGDFITVGEKSGFVKDIGIFYTTVITLDNCKISIPNSLISGKELSAFSVKGSRRVDLDFSVAYDTDLEKAKEALITVAKNCSLSKKEPVPAAFVKQYADSAIVLTLRYWCQSKDYWASVADINNNMKTEFDKNGISFPFPQLDVHLDK